MRNLFSVFFPPCFPAVCTVRSHSSSLTDLLHPLKYSFPGERSGRQGDDGGHGGGEEGRENGREEVLGSFQVKLCFSCFPYMSEQGGGGSDSPVLGIAPERRPKRGGSGMILVGR